MSHLENLKINLANLQPETPLKPKRKKTLIIFFLFIFISIILPPFFLAQQFNLTPSEIIWTSLKSLGTNKDRPLKGEQEDRINFLLLGMGGEGHSGAYLTDTMILVSLRPSDGRLAFLSIPRDLLVFIPNYGWRRINNANAFAENQKPGSGAAFTADLVSRLFNLPIHYYARLDFQGFKQLIDEVGGVRVYVDKSFTDSLYPTEDFKYQTISFEKGWQTMDGDKALKFVRSRHGTNGENNDFARSRRQQKVLLALREKLLSYETLLQPNRIRHILNILSQHLSTNLEMWEVLRLAKILTKISPEKISLKILDDGPNGLLEDKITEDGAFVLQPKNGWGELRALVLNLLNDNSAETLTSTSNIVIAIQNGTLIPGLAAKTASLLEQEGFIVASIGNAPVRNYSKTVIYDLSRGSKPHILNQLQQELDAEVSLAPPSWFITPPSSSKIFSPNNQAQAKDREIDFLIVLGKNTF
jgi:LCP family protein required for cell wall assembly